MGSEYRTPLNGLIIAGGESRRMGTDKALLAVNGRPLLSVMIDRMSELCSRIVVAVGDCERIKVYQEAVLPHCITPASRIAFAIDRYAGCGPLAGLHAGLAELQDGYALVMGCDMPQLSETLLERMAAAAERDDADVAHAAGQPFHAVYHTRVGRQALERLEQEDYRFMRLLDDAKSVLVEPQSEEERQAFANLNSPEAYQAYKDQASQA